MEMVKNKWEHFGNNFETLSVWITEKEKELNALEATPSAMDMQTNQIKVTCSHVRCIYNPCLAFKNSFLAFHPMLFGPRTNLSLLCDSIKIKFTQIAELRDLDWYRATAYRWNYVLILSDLSIQS